MNIQTFMQGVIVGVTLTLGAAVAIKAYPELNKPVNFSANCPEGAVSVLIKEKTYTCDYRYPGYFGNYVKQRRFERSTGEEIVDN